MPVEIKELVIKAVVNNSQTSLSSQEEVSNNHMSQTEIINECVNQVMKILHQAKER